MDEQGLSAALMGEPCTLRECPPGAFMFQGRLGFKTEYGAAILGTNERGLQEFVISEWPDAYCMDSGEFFWGGTSTHADRAMLIVQPVEFNAARTDTRSPPPGDVREEVARSNWSAIRSKLSTLLVDVEGKGYELRSAYIDKCARELDDLALSALPIQGGGSEALGSVTPSASPSVVSRVSESGPATPSGGVE